VTPLLRTRSLRARLLLGSVLWTAGLVILASSALVHALDGSASFRHMLTVHAVFRHPLVLAFALLAATIGVVQVRRGLSPINMLRSRLALVHQGHDRRVAGSYPAEVQPLVNDLNALLDHREQAVQRALAKAGDLAHGLKTPLAVLARESERAIASGHEELGSAIAQQVERMRRQVDYHLAHARAAASAASPGAHCSVRESTDGLVRALSRLHADRGVVFDIQVPAVLAVRVQREDLDEMLGNLLDNACKWGHIRVRVSAVASAAFVDVVIEDDGNGLAAAEREAVLRRGVRADQAMPGSGLGLAIVRELAELYGGSVSLGDSRLGGLAARLRLPASAGGGDPTPA
jgi:signal transduction histidine kinase